MPLRCLFVLLLVLARPALATVLLPTDFAEMVTSARAIVHGRVIDVRSELTFDRTAIASFVTIEVEQNLKGALGESVTFRVPGGQVGRYRRVIVGVPEFQEGDEVIVFLSVRGPSFPYLYGLSQGVYRVMPDAAGRRTVMPPAMAASADGSARIVRGDPARRPLPVEAFAQQVQSVLERGR